VNAAAAQPDEHFMRLALDLAAKAGDGGEVPVGAVVVSGGEVIAEGANGREVTQDPDRPRRSDRAARGSKSHRVVASFGGQPVRHPRTLSNVRRSVGRGQGEPGGVRCTRPQSWRLRVALQLVRRSPAQPRVSRYTGGAPPGSLRPFVGLVRCETALVAPVNPLGAIATA
jgi:hypothetical protein